MNRVTLACSVVVLLLVFACVHPAGAQGVTQTITLRASDGVPIAATLYLPARRAGQVPAVILLHMLTRTRDDWQPLASRLADAGLAALAIDLRGHGASGMGPEPAADDLGADLFDVQAARAFLKGRPDIAADRIGIAGASIGANLAVLQAANDPGVRSIALLSAGLDYRGLRIDAAMKKYNERPALIVASQDDPYALSSARQLAGAGTGMRELKLLNDAGHGTVMLTRQPDLIAALVDWFQRTLV
jgi:dienelactone hydrolase